MAESILPSTFTALASPPATGWDAAIARAGGGAVESPGGSAVRSGAAHAADPLAHLPETARAKFQELEDGLADVRTLGRESSDRLNDLIQSRLGAKQRFDLLTDPVTARRLGDGRVYPNSHPSVSDAAARLNRAAKELERAQERADARSHRSQQLSQLHGACERYLKQTHGQTLVAFTGMKPKKQRGESHLQAVEKCRKEQATLRADLHEVGSAPATSEETKEKIRAEVEALAKSGTPDLYSLLERGAAGVGWPQHQIQAKLTGLNPLLAPDKSTTYATGIAHDTVPDGLALVVWLNKDALLERLEAEIDCIADDGNALSAEDRLAKAISINAALLDSERAEEHFIEQAEAEGTEITRRPETDVRAFLAIIGPALEAY